MIAAQNEAGTFTGNSEWNGLDQLIDELNDDRSELI